MKNQKNLILAMLVHKLKDRIFYVFLTCQRCTLLSLLVDSLSYTYLVQNKNYNKMFNSQCLCLFALFNIELFNYHIFINA